MVSRKLRIRRDRPMLMLECALCAEKLPHHCVEAVPPMPESTAHELFRATTLPSGDVYVPVKHADPKLCPDPPSSTRSFWKHTEKRERWKQQRREERLQ